MNQREARPERGRTIILAIVITTVALSAGVIVAFLATQGTARLPQQVVRFILTCVLGYFLYRGARWARWTAVVLFSLAALGFFVGGAGLLRDSAGGLALVILGLVYASAALSLCVVPSVRTYFKARSGAA